MVDINSLLLPEARKEDDARFVSPVSKAFQAEAEQQETSGLDHVKSGFDLTAISAGHRAGTDSKQLAEEHFARTDPDNVNADENKKAINTAFATGLVGFAFDSGEGWDTKADDIEELLDGIPRSMAEDIMDEPTLNAALQARGRILEDLAASQRSAVQWEGGALNMMGSLIDIDAPLMVLSGGMIGAAKTARLASLVSKNKHFVGAVQQGSAGLQAGVAVGAYDALVRETADEATFIASVIGGFAMGTTIGTISGPVRQSITDLEADYARRIETGDVSLNATSKTAVSDAPTESFVVKRPVTETPSDAVVTPLDGSPPKKSKAFTAEGEVVPEIKVHETTIAPDKVEGTATQKKPCMRE